LRSRDRWRGLVMGFMHWKLDLFADHGIHHYAQHIATAVTAENAALAQNHAAKTADDLAIRNSDEAPCDETKSPIETVPAPHVTKASNVETISRRPGGR